ELRGLPFLDHRLLQIAQLLERAWTRRAARGEHGGHHQRLAAPIGEGDGLPILVGPHPATAEERCAIDVRRVGLAAALLRRNATATRQEGDESRSPDRSPHVPGSVPSTDEGDAAHLLHGIEATTQRHRQGYRGGGGTPVMAVSKWMAFLTTFFLLLASLACAG